MYVNTPVYVAGLDRGVRPMGDWSMATTLSMCARPRTFLYASGGVFEPKKCCARTRYSVSLIRVDLPEPDTPVMHVNVPRGKRTSIF